MNVASYPANRCGSHIFNAAQLKTIQEIITLIVFSFFSVWYLKQEVKWNYRVGVLYLGGGVLYFQRVVSAGVGGSFMKAVAGRCA